MRKGKLEVASVSFNKALRLSPDNSYFQFLNALTYHIMAETGDPSNYDIAKVGYKLALKFDAANWLAAGQLAQLHMTQQRYKLAQDYFGYALLARPKDPDLLYGMARAAYFAQDLETARGTIEIVNQQNPNSPEVKNAYSIILAATGDIQGARTSLREYQALEAKPARVSRLDARIDDWERIHGEISEDDDDLQGVQDLQGAQVESETYISESRINWEDPSDLADHEKMVVVDIIILRTEEFETTNKGLNILDSLVVLFSGSVDYNRTEPSGDPPFSERIFSRRLAVEELRYNLNIFNAGDERNEILATSFKRTAALTTAARCVAPYGQELA